MSNLENIKMAGLVTRQREQKERRSVVVLRNNANTLDSDRAIYNEPDSLRIAPVGACLCDDNNCKERRAVQTYGGHMIENSNVCLTSESYNTLCLTYADNRYIELKYKTHEKRMVTFNNDRRFSDAGFNRRLADAGFYLRPQNGEQGSAVSLACFRCPLQLRMLEYSFDPDREHARWFPTCAHITHRKGMEFIHGVLEDTKRIQQEHEAILGAGGQTNEEYINVRNGK